MTERIGRGARSGENRFKNHQIRKRRETVNEIGNVLEILRPQGVRFRNVTHLASYVAAVISDKRGPDRKQAATSTLLRTKAYRVKLDGYLASMEEISHADKFEKLITDLELKELDELRVENKRLSQYIEKNLSREPEPSLSRPSTASMQNVDQLCRAISLLLEASAGLFVIDQETGEIVNAWAKSKKNRIVVPASISKQYLEWHNSFPMIGKNKDAS